MKRAVRLVRAFDNTTEKLRRQVVRFDPDLRQTMTSRSTRLRNSRTLPGPWITKKNF